MSRAASIADLFAIAEMRRAYGRPPAKPRPTPPSGMLDLGPEVTAGLLPVAPPPYALDRIYHRGRVAMAAVLLRPAKEAT